jgi:hypothetical protein
LEELNMHSDCSDPRSSLRAARSRRHKTATVAVAAALMAACGGGSDEAIAERESPAGAGSCTTRRNDSIAKLLECVTLAAVRAHQAAFQQIVDATGGTRAAGTPGYDASVDYVMTKLAAAGYLCSRIVHRHRLRQRDGERGCCGHQPRAAACQHQRLRSR